MATVATGQDLLPEACRKCQKSLDAGEIANRQTVCMACLLPLVESLRWWSRQSVFIEGVVTGLLLAFWPKTVLAFSLAICLMATIHETRKERRIRRAVWCQGENRRWHQWQWREVRRSVSGGTILEKRSCSVCNAQADEDFTFASQRDRCLMCGASAIYRGGDQIPHGPSCAGATQ